jgi:hypothetical protein
MGAKAATIIAIGLVAAAILSNAGYTTTTSDSGAFIVHPLTGSVSYCSLAVDGCREFRSSWLPW